MRLNTDNPELMPITHSVYGPKPRRPEKPERKRPPDTSGQLWRRLSQEQLTALREQIRQENA